MRDYDIESDLKQEKFQSLKLVQGDRGNKIKINVYEDGQPVNLAGCSVTAKYKRADGEIINDGVIENIHDNSFDAVMDSSITKVAGTLKMLFTIEKDAVKVSAFLLLADVREGIGESSSSGGSAGGGEVTVDLSDYYKKIETYSRKEIDAQFKDIANKIDNIGGFDTSKFMYVTEEVDESIACTDMVLSATELTFTGSENKTITATLTPSNTTDILTYSSNNKSVATVDNNGIVTAVGNGSCTITATCGSIIKTCTVSVSGITTTVAVTGVTLDKSTASVSIGETVTLIETVQPTNATNQNVTWSSDAENIATVENGIVTGVAEGTASIGVATQDGGFSATCNVTVNAVQSEYSNIFDKDTMLAEPPKGINSTNKYVTTYASWKACEIPVKANTQYSIKKCESTSSSKYGAGTNGNFGFLDSEKNLITSLHFAKGEELTELYLKNYPLAVAIEDYSNTGTTTIDWITLTTPENCAYLVFNTALNASADTIQVEEGNTIHNYYLAYSGGTN